MRYRDVAGHCRVYVCNHVFDGAAAVNVVSTEEDGSLAMTCGCVPDEVRVAGFGHFGGRVPDLLDRDVLAPGRHYWRVDERSPWSVRVNPR